MWYEAATPCIVYKMDNLRVQRGGRCSSTDHQTLKLH